jgi:protein tyrosine/serine phosphatase
VSRDAIIEDYMVSRTAPGLMELLPEVERIVRRQLDRAVSSHVAERLLLVEERYILAAFNEMEARCGSLDNYLELIGCDASVRDQLCARLLE